MIKLQRHPNNPIIKPNPARNWEHDGAFNGCVVEHDGVYHMVYRALSSEQEHENNRMRISSVGYAKSTDGVNFGEHRMLFGPSEDWDIYGCEDPRITYFEEKYYIFYTALSSYPFAAHGIKTAVAITSDFETFERHPVSTFNAKAMALFPERINGKIAALISINTDLPPAKVALALFDTPADIYSPYYWDEWYDNANSHIIHLMRDIRDQIEVGGVPIKTKDGWLVIYSYIKNYLSNEKEFGIEAVLLDLNDPKNIIGRTHSSLLVPETKYELLGDVVNIVFPSGALVHEGKLHVYYGAADTRCALATCELEDLLKELKSETHIEETIAPSAREYKLIRFEGNPILAPIFELGWQARCVFNPTAIYEAGKVHIIYRAQAMDGTSVFGYATSKDGLHIDENLDEPIYVPREPFEMKTHPVGNSGCEDPRISKIGDTFYMTYTAYDGSNPPRVALTSILVEDFLNRKWNWKTPKLVSHPKTDDKDACVVKDKNNNGYIVFHRLGVEIWVDILRDLQLGEGAYLAGKILAHPREGKWDNVKIGIAGPPIETEKGWLLLYHGVGSGSQGRIYKVGAMLLDYDDPFKVLGRSDQPIFEPEEPYEKVGEVPNVVFPCGAVVLDGILYVYYGGADQVVGVATISLDSLLNYLLGKQ